MTEKSDLRRHFLDVRQTLAPEDVVRYTKAISERLLALAEVARAETVLSYVAALGNEVDTKPIIASLLRDHRTVLVPVMAKGRRLDWSRLEALEELAPNHYGVPEPMPAYLRLTAPPSDAAVLVPGIAFTPSGYRIGFGGGYYDRFLAGHKGPKIGLAYDCQMLASFATEDHDVPVDIIVTESAVHRCTK